MDDGIHVLNLDETVNALALFEDLSFLNAVLMAGAETLRNVVADYPPSRSTPGRFSRRTGRPMGYYERGRGSWYPIVRRVTLGKSPRKTLGAVLAQKNIRQSSQVVGYKLSKSGQSETLGRRWTIASRNPTTVVLGNNASYAPWVQSKIKISDGRGPQAHVHDITGWLTVEDAADQTEAEIARNIEREILKRFSNAG